MDMRSIIPWSRERTTPGGRNGDMTPFFSLHRQIDRMFDEFMRDLDWPTGKHGWTGQWPTVELRDGDKEVTVKAELPGLEEKDVEVTLTDGVLTLKGEKHVEEKDSVYSEIWHGSFERQIPVGDVDPDKVKASFKNGVLTVTLEKKPEAQQRVKRIPLHS